MTARPVVADGAPDEVDEAFTLLAGPDGVWVLAGEVDHVSAGPLRRALAATARVRVAGDWVVDVGSLEFTDVAGMRAIALAADDARRPLTLRSASRTFRRYWRLAGFEDAAPRVRFAD